MADDNDIARAKHGILKMLEVRYLRIRAGEKEGDKHMRLDKLLEVLPEKKIKPHLIDIKAAKGDDMIDNPYRSSNEAIEQVLMELKRAVQVAKVSNSNPERYAITDMGLAELSKLEPKQWTKGARRMGIRQQERQ